MTPGDIVLVDFDPRFGHEQSGKRPAIIVTTESYNANSSLVVVCPITSRVSSWPWKVGIQPDQTVSGFIIVDQVRSIDQQRLLRHLGAIDETSLQAVRSMLGTLLLE